MFENDDFDEVLSQFSCPELMPVNEKAHLGNNKSEQPCTKTSFKIKPESLVSKSYERKRKKILLLEKVFDFSKKPNIAGPAGYLTGSVDQLDDNTAQLEITSQDWNELLRNNITDDKFISELWHSVSSDMSNQCQDTISSVKQRASSGTLIGMKADCLFALVQAIERSGPDPRITLRDPTGEISGTLHREVWAAFSPYLLPEFAVLSIFKPTVLTGGRPIKEHHLIITMNNVLAVHCSKSLLGEIREVKQQYRRSIPDCFTLTETDNLVVFKMRERPMEDGRKSKLESQDEYVAQHLLDGLDAASFCEDFI